jgi:hypothetical protein
MPLPLLLPGIVGLSAGGAAGAAGAGTAGAGALGLGKLSLSEIMMLVSLFGGLLEKEKDPYEEALKLQQQMSMLGIRPPYQSRYPQQLDPAIVQALLTQLKRTSNWGWPEGMGTDTSLIENLLKNIGTGSLGMVRRKQTGGILGG